MCIRDRAYSGESGLSYLTQSLGLTVQNFVSAGTGLAVLYLSLIHIFSMIMNLALNMIVGTIIIMVGYTRKHN